MIPNHSTQSDRPLRTDNRAVSEVIGAILVFALLFLVLALIQLNAVPAANQEVEFEHNQRAVGDFQELQDGIYRASSTGQEGAVPVETGVSYPSRFFLLNPGPSTGTLRTTGEQELLIHNATAVGNIGDFWNGTLRNYSTTGLTYEPNYKELSGAGTLHLEHSMLYRDFGEDNRYFDDPTGFVDGNRIRLTLLVGEFSRNSLSTSVELAPVSYQQRTITVQNRSEKQITITFQTELDRDTLNETIRDVEPNVENITKSGNTATMTLKQGVSYELSMSKVRVGSTNVEQPGPRYITDIVGNGTNLPEDTSQRLVVEVRDKYNNPVSNISVDTNIDVSPGNDNLTSIGGTRTDSDGRMTFRYDAPSDVDGPQPIRINTTIENGIDNTTTDPLERARFDLTIVDSDQSGSPPGNVSDDGVSRINPWNDAVRLIDVEKVTGDKKSDLHLTFRNDAGETMVFQRARLLFYDTQAGSVNQVNVTEYYDDAEWNDILTPNTLELYQDYQEITPDDTQSIELAKNEEVKLGLAVVGGSSDTKDFIGISVIFTDSNGVERVTNYFIDPPN